MRDQWLGSKELDCQDKKREGQCSSPQKIPGENLAFIFTEVQQSTQMYHLELSHSHARNAVLHQKDMVFYIGFKYKCAMSSVIQESYRYGIILYIYSSPNDHWVAVKKLCYYNSNAQLCQWGIPFCQN